MLWTYRFIPAFSYPTPIDVMLRICDYTLDIGASPRAVSRDLKHGLQAQETRKWFTLPREPLGQLPTQGLFSGPRAGRFASLLHKFPVRRGKT
jgi:hypothetical protein